MKNKLVLQWHITSRCNKRCSHCYQEEYSDKEFTTSELLDIGSQYLELLREYNKVYGVKEKGHINITGGEPFIREDIFKILDFFKDNKDEFTFGILTNGSLIDEKVVKKLSEYNPRMVQVSLDGDKDTHDKIRGRGAYEEVLNALKMLNRYKIKGIVSFTANNENYKRISKVIKVARRAKAYKVWSDRMVPIGSGSSGSIRTLSSDEVVDYLSIMRKEKSKFINRYRKTIISMDRSLQFLSGEGSCYKCSAGDGLVIVLENGDVLPCRRLPIKAGNIKEKRLNEIYFNSDVMKEIRNISNKVPKQCEKCSFYDICGGGAKCISYGIYGDYTIADYGCPIKNREL
ncbi:Radical SAM domain protein [Clostridium bornimense]|uniref:Radical SAM domain protein n=1 Tax=Clostridium bornimense TaxID=1216932 RepID=W6SEK1_9CLOT|nr:radical SAM protein [Clostridium bornimense]CDM68085.1 Radical SAM domain protein [Clostridium bornimense]